MTAPPPDIRAVERFLFHEAALLDDRRFADWLALFTDSAWYWVPLSPDQADPFESVSIIYDDRKLLEMRVRRLLSANIHAEEPRTRTSRIIGNVVIVENGTGDSGIETGARFQMVEYRGGRKRIFAGRVRHGLVADGTAFRIAWKRVDLVDCDDALEGITIPF
jgi:3-phenylpropionate/cinnamic acid dioxygenase small subunit